MEVKVQGLAAREEWVFQEVIEERERERVVAMAGVGKVGASRRRTVRAIKIR